MELSPEINALLERVKNGEELSQSDRLDALTALEMAGTLNSTKLGALLGVTDRTIRRDRAELRARAQRALKDLNLVGELHRQFELTLERIDRAIERENYQQVKSLALRWGVCESFVKIGFNFQLDELAKLIERTRGKILTEASVHASDSQALN